MTRLLNWSAISMSPARLKPPAAACAAGSAADAGQAAASTIAAVTIRTPTAPAARCRPARFELVIEDSFQAGPHGPAVSQWRGANRVLWTHSKQRARAR